MRPRRRRPPTPPAPARHALLPMSYLAWAPSAYDNTSLAPEDRRRGVWSYDSKDERVARRDPSGYVTPAPEPARPGLLADMPPVAPAMPASAPPFSPLASPPASPEKSGMTTTKASFEFTRRKKALKRAYKRS